MATASLGQLAQKLLGEARERVRSNHDAWLRDIDEIEKQTRAADHSIAPSPESSLRLSALMARLNSSDYLTVLAIEQEIAQTRQQVFTQAIEALTESVSRRSEMLDAAQAQLSDALRQREEAARQALLDRNSAERAASDALQSVQELRLRGPVAFYRCPGAWSAQFGGIECCLIGNLTALLCFCVMLILWIPYAVAILIIQPVCRRSARTLHAGKLAGIQATYDEQTAAIECEYHQCLADLQKAAAEARALLEGVQAASGKLKSRLKGGRQS
jgi:hypothetical protein